MGSYYHAIGNARKFARAFARDTFGMSIGRFRQIAGLESDIGPEWIAESRRDDGYVALWRPMGEGLANLPRLGQSDGIRTFGGHVFIVSVRDPTKPRLSQKQQ